MKYFEMFAGVAGFSLGIQNAYENNNECQHISKKSKQEKCPQGRIRTSVQPKEMLCDTDRTATLCVGFSEIDKYASQVLKYHFPNIKNYGDCSKIKWSEVPDFDLLIGGSPCQDFSIAGKRKGILGERSGLIWEFIRCLKEKKPRYFIWENVKGVMSSRRGYDFGNIITAFSESGYNLWWQVLNAKDFGVPQNRERLFVVGYFGKESPGEVFFETGVGGQALKELSRNKPQGYRVYDTKGIATSQASQAGGGRGKNGVVCYKRQTKI